MRKKRGKTKRNTGKPFEDKVAAAIRELYPGAKVDTDVKLPAVITGGMRQIDTLLNQEGVLTDFDAKDHSRRIGIDTVAAYSFKLKDEQVPNGVMVSNSPYATSAVNAAEHLDVRLTHLIDTTDKENPFKIRQKTLVIDKFVRSLRFGIRHTGVGRGISIDPDLGKAVLVSEDGERLTAYEVFRMLWNEGVLPSEEGARRYTLPQQRVVMHDGDIVAVTEFYFDYLAETVYRQGEWGIEEAKGLYDVKQGSFTSNKDLASEVLSAEEVNEWPSITKEEAEAAQFGITLSVVSQLPEKPPSMQG